ncbi:Microcin B17-processing protein McbD, partial [Bienertia sinuspersici]
MDLRATKEKLALPIKSAEYRVGVDDFMVYATRSLTSSDGKLRCPCIKCVNNKLLSPDDVNYHLLHFGIMRNYNNWTFHGEVVDEISFEPMVENETRGETNLRQLVHDTYGLWLIERIRSYEWLMLIQIGVKSMLEILNSQTLITPGSRINNIKVLIAEIKEVMRALGMKRKRTKDAFMNTLCKARFLYPNALEKWILKSIGLKWKDYKCYLKGRYYNDDIDINIVQDRCPSDVEKDQWISLVNFWRSEEGKKRSKRGKESLMNAKVKPISTTGTKSHARVREELKKELKKSPTRTQTYLACHTHDNEAEITVYFMAMHLFWSFKLSIPNYFINDTQNQIKSIVAEQGDKEMNLDDDPVSKVLGKDQYGRVRGLGLGAKPSNFAEISAPPYWWTQRLNKRVKRQDTTIKKLKSKLQSSGSSDFDEDDDFNIHGVDK